MEEQYDFDGFYSSQLASSLDELEAIRKKGVRKFKRQIFISLPFFVLLVLIIVIFPEPILILIPAFIFVAIFGIGIGKIGSTRRELRPKFKKAVLFPVLRYLYEDIEYIPRQKMAKSVLNKSLLLKKKVHRTIGDDFVRCKIGETRIQFSEIEAYHGSNAGMFYAGIFISASFNKSFKTKTVVLPEQVGSRGQRFALKYKGHMENPQFVKLEDPIFERQFVVIGEDQVESRYLLSPSLMKRLIEYEKRFKKRVSFSFINNKLYISIPIMVNMFEPRIFEPINDKEFIKYNYDYFKLLTDVVCELDLDTRIWL